jgi:hypothetical protein
MCVGHLDEPVDRLGGVTPNVRHACRVCRRHAARDDRVQEQRPSDDGKGAEQTLARSCLQWHQAAGAVVSQMVYSTRDADLQQVSDLVFRMRQARQNCATGWVTLACQDYHAVVTTRPGAILSTQWFPCSPIDWTDLAGAHPIRVLTRVVWAH